MKFTFAVPSVTYFGEGCTEDLGNIAIDAGGRNVLFVYDQGVKATGIVDRLTGILARHLINVIDFDGVLPDPPDHAVEKAAELAREKQIDLIVACGGGSSLDTAKAINILMTNSAPINDYEGIDKVTNPGVPLIAVPTTAGTASEMTSFCVVTDTIRKKKLVIGGKHVGPSIALVDPLLTQGMPPTLTAATGMDALTHAIEAYVSKAASVPTDVNAIKAIELISSNLLTATQNGHSVEARTGMALGSMMAGMAFNSTGLGLAHAIAHPLSAHCHLPHGLANAVVLPYVMQFNLIASPKKFKEIAVAMGEDISGMSELSAAEKSVDCVAKLNQQLNVPTLAQCSVTPELFSRLADDALLELAIETNPRKVTKENILMILKEAFSGVCLQRQVSAA